MARNLIALICFGLLFCSVNLFANEEPIRLDLRLMAADLTDEMVYSWLQTAPVGGSASFVVAEIDGPIAIDQRFEQDIENHLYELLSANPRLTLSLVHCSLCRQSLTVSSPKRTVMGRVLSLPEGQEMLRQYPQMYALGMHFDVVDQELVLWAEIYEVAPPQKVAWARRFSVSTSARSVLRDPTRLISLQAAREEQHQLMVGHDNIQAVTRLPVRIFSANTGGSGGPQGEIAPLLFLEQSIEGVLSPRRNRRAGISVGLTSIKGSMQGWSVGASFSQLLGRGEPSLSEPDLYFRAAATYLRLEGSGAAVFSQNQLDVNKLINSTDDPRASLMAYQIGLEAHVKYRFGLAAFIEYIPALNSSQLIQTQHFIVPFHTIGVSGVFLW